MARFQSAVSLNVSVFFLMVGVGLTVSLLPARMAALSGSFSDVGCLASCFALPFVLLQLPMGTLADRYGCTWFLAAGYAVCGLAALAYGLAETPNFLYLGRFLQGVGEVPVWALAPALLSMDWSEGRGKILGLYNASMHLGLTAGGLLGLLFCERWGGSGPFWLLAATGFSGGLLVLWGVGDKAGARAPRSGGWHLRSAWALVVTRETRAVFSGVVLYGCGYGVFLTVIPMSLVAGRGGGENAVSLFFVLFYVAVGLAQLMGGALSDKAGRVVTMSLGLILAGGCLPLAAWASGPALLGFLAMAGFGLGVFCVSAMAALSESVPVSRRGTISGAFYLAWGTGFFTGPMLLGTASDHGGFGPGLLVFSALILCNAGVLAACFGRGRVVA
ncbi:MFS transporter [Desulfoluna butyratoxydans]|uniref:Major facilitator superfamily n=1 Tax=Desulfoluna butyratoxydans TaxID=231438 RepID=A0A4U8YMT0_9BACT|nr:MFS transporter [Desulfoluna butyratoxydans]VFQ44854.1 major facilitator superfamily [Desulfoluna butyratoxydans]